MKTTDYGSNSTMSNEKIVQVPLSDEAKAALEARAEANGRATGREAAQIINKAVLKKPPEAK